MRKPQTRSLIDASVQRRLEALEWLIDHEYDESPSVFEAKTGIRMAQVNQWFSGYRALREKALRRLEEATRKPEGWFDQVHGPVATFAPTAAALLESSSGVSAQPPVDLSVALKLLADRLDRLEDAGRELAAQRMQTLARAPDSARALEALITVLNGDQVIDPHAGAPVVAPGHQARIDSRVRDAEERREQELKGRRTSKRKSP